MRKILCLLSVLSLLSGKAVTTVSDVIVNQRWPWSEKVDVDFTLTGEKADVDVTATWDGQASPVLIGTAFDATSGLNRVTWDPTATPWAGLTLTGFSVTLTPASAAAHAYLVIDLQDGGVSYRAAPDGADGKWSDAYKTTKMVFRRIPAGTYTNGIDSAALTKMNGGSTPSIAGAVREREVTFTSDCYVGVFQMTGGQYNRMMEETKYSGGDLFTPAQVSYDALRGSTAEGVDWPATKYAVASNSVVAKLRAKVGENLMVDLCEDEQWEIAARAGVRTYWTNGGVIDEDAGVWTNYVNDIAIWKRNSTMGVGCKEPNPWGLYDTVGNLREWTLDKTAVISGGTVDTTPRTDPVGPETGAHRVYRGWIMQVNPPLCYMVPANRNDAPPDTPTVSVRFCIHLNPLDFGK